MDRDDQRRYLVVGSVILEVVTPLFQQKTENEYTTGGFGSLQAFINSQQVIHTLFHLRHRNSLCCKDKAKCRNHAALPLVYCQWKKLYSENPGPGIHNCHCKFTANQVQLNEMDISLSSLILLNCCNLSQPEEEAVQLLRQYKNDYLSHNTTGCITRTEYNTLWPDLVTYVLRLDPSENDALVKIEHRPLDKSLCKKYFTFLLDLHQQIEEIKSTMENVHSSIQAVSSLIIGLNISVEAAVQGMDTTFMEWIQQSKGWVQQSKGWVQQSKEWIKQSKEWIQQFKEWEELLKKGLTCECGRKIINPLYNDQPRKHRNQYHLGQNIFYLHQQHNLEPLLKITEVSDVKMMDDGRLVSCIPYKNSILICNNDGSHTYSISVQGGEPVYVTVVNNSTVAALVVKLFSFEIIIEVYDINNKHKLQSISVPGIMFFCGITTKNKKFVVGSATRLLIIDHQTGETVQTIETGCIPYRIHASGDKIFFSDLSVIDPKKTPKMYCCFDNKVFTKTLPSDPYSFTSLQDGSVYVLCEDGSILHVSNDFKHVKKVKINNKEVLNDHCIISYNTKQNKMVVL
ncbi:unnamed protein product [Mytilus coruscus]|uniref:Uncharacterized protein n=1 Tax=Mytilus coruscus TaxID=42192 RepID=A0A6J8AIC0_MYTCO|nr:unnamed protein product [Mytilus coruscus]